MPLVELPSEATRDVQATGHLSLERLQCSRNASVLKITLEGQDQRYRAVSRICEPCYDGPLTTPLRTQLGANEGVVVPEGQKDLWRVEVLAKTELQGFARA